MGQNIEMPLSMTSTSDEEKKQFLVMVKGGMSPSLASILSTRRAPVSSCNDREFCKDLAHNFRSMSSLRRDNLLKTAKASGINTQGKYYMPNMGGAADPRAWVSGTSDAIESAKSLGKSLSGTVNYSHPNSDADEPAPEKVNENVVQELVSETIAADPKTQEKVKQNPEHAAVVREKVIDKHFKKS